MYFFGKMPEIQAEHREKNKNFVCPVCSKKVFELYSQHDSENKKWVTSLYCKNKECSYKKVLQENKSDISLKIKRR